MTRTNDMTTWDAIACERGCAEHFSRSVDVDLRYTHGYRDLAQVPDDLAVRFSMQIWDTDRTPVDGGPYCPARDAVSETILSHGIWEPRETILALSVLRGARSDQWFVDLGCQIGWYSLLALSLGVPTWAVDADPENLALLRMSAAPIAVGMVLLETVERRLDASTREWPAMPIRLAKLDIEGAEADGVRILGPSIEAGLVDHLMIEVSPRAFPKPNPDHYYDLLAGLIGQGYEAYLLPEKSNPPRPFENPEQYLAPYRIDGLLPLRFQAIIDGWWQEDVWFKREGAAW